MKNPHKYDQNIQTRAAMAVELGLVARREDFQGGPPYLEATLKQQANWIKKAKKKAMARHNRIKAENSRKTKALVLAAAIREHEKAEKRGIEIKELDLIERARELAIRRFSDFAEDLGIEKPEITVLKGTWKHPVHVPNRLGKERVPNLVFEVWGFRFVVFPVKSFFSETLGTAEICYVGKDERGKRALSKPIQDAYDLRKVVGKALDSGTYSNFHNPVALEETPKAFEVSESEKAVILALRAMIADQMG